MIHIIFNQSSWLQFGVIYNVLLQYCCGNFNTYQQNVAFVSFPELFLIYQTSSKSVKMYLTSNQHLTMVEKSAIVAIFMQKSGKDQSAVSEWFFLLEFGFTKTWTYVDEDSTISKYFQMGFVSRVVLKILVRICAKFDCVSNGSSFYLDWWNTDRKNGEVTMRNKLNRILIAHHLSR